LVRTDHFDRTIRITTVIGKKRMAATMTSQRGNALDDLGETGIGGTDAGELGRGRSVEQVRIVELPVMERGPVLRAFLQQVRGGVRFFGSADPDVVVAGADRYPVFRLDSN
jgi:hypothetical protein